MPIFEILVFFPYFVDYITRLNSKVVLLLLLIYPNHNVEKSKGHGIYKNLIATKNCTENVTLDSGLWKSYLAIKFLKTCTQINSERLKFKMFVSVA